MTFTRSRTAEGRFRTTCDRCGLTQASWTSTTLSRWQLTHQCKTTQDAATPAAS